MQKYILFQDSHLAAFRIEKTQTIKTLKLRPANVKPSQLNDNLKFCVLQLSFFQLRSHALTRSEESLLEQIRPNRSPADQSEKSYSSISDIQGPVIG